MAETTFNTGLAEKKTLGSGYVFGAPVKDLGFVATVLMALGSGMMSFFAATFVGIVGILIYNSNGHKADFSLSYRWGWPVGAVVMLAVLGYLGVFWVKRVFRKG